MDCHTSAKFTPCFPVNTFASSLSAPEPKSVLLALSASLCKSVFQFTTYVFHQGLHFPSSSTRHVFSPPWNSDSHLPRHLLHASCSPFTDLLSPICIYPSQVMPYSQFSLCTSSQVDIPSKLSCLSSKICSVASSCFTDQ